MKCRTFSFFVTLLFFAASQSSAIEIGIAWEFNQDGDTEGWQALNSLSDLTVSNGTLKATVTGDWAQFASPEFELRARDYGFLQIRMKAIGPQSAVLSWTGDSTLFSFQKFSVIGDSFFHVYEIPMYRNGAWKGTIQQIARLTMLAQKRTQIEIDYVRIVSTGVRPEIATFKPLRTILKPGQEVPLMAVVKNSGDKDGVLNAIAQFPQECDLLQGNRETDLGLLARGENDTLRWTFRCSSSGTLQFKLSLLAETDTVEATFDANITDTFWKLDNFFLSAWSPPSLTTEAYDYYAAANFDFVLTLPVDESAVARVEQYDMRCQLNAGSVVGQNRYLRAPDNYQAEELTADVLAKLDGMINAYRDKPAVTGYYLTDEPNAHAFPNLGKMVAYLREKDPTRLSYINLFPTYASEYQLGTETYDEHIEQFLDIVKPELLSYDHYHFFKDGDGSEYFLNLGIIRKWSLRYDVPFCNIIQAVGYDPLNWRIPTAGEHRWLVYSSLAYGAKGIVWFHWDSSWGVTGSPARDQLFTSIQQLNKEIKTIGPEMIRLKSTGVYHSLRAPLGGVPLPDDALVKSVSGNADLVVGFFEDDKGKDFLMLMNKDYRDSVTASVILNRNVDDLQIFDVASGQWHSLDHHNEQAGTSFNISLRPGGGKLLAIGDATGVQGSRGEKNPMHYVLKQNYPNPFNPVTTIEYELGKSDHVKLAVYDLLGRELDVLVDAKQKAGKYRISWSAKKYTSGVYICALWAGGTVLNRKMIVMK